MEKLAFTLITASFCLAAFVRPDPVKLRFFCNKISSTEPEICIEAKIDKGWQMYFSKMTDGDPVKSSIRFKHSPYYRFAYVVELLRHGLLMPMTMGSK